MCKFKSFVAVRGIDEPMYLDTEDSHEKLIKEANLRDDKLIGRNFVRLEYSPRVCLTSVNQDEWKFVEDEQDTLPKWYIENKENIKDKCWAVMKKIVGRIIERGEYAGDLDLSNTPITSLGSLQSVGGNLDLYNTPITSLGNLQSVGEYLNLSNTPITSLGNLQSVGEYLDLSNTPITSLGSLRSVGGDLDLSNTLITSLGSLQSVGGDLGLYGTQIPESEVAKVKVGREIYR